MEALKPCSHQDVMLESSPDPGADGRSADGPPYPQGRHSNALGVNCHNRGLRFPLTEGDWPAVRARVRGARQTNRGGTLEQACAGMSAHHPNRFRDAAMFMAQDDRAENRVPDQLMMTMVRTPALDMPHLLASLR